MVQADHGDAPVGFSFHFDQAPVFATTITCLRVLRLVPARREVSIRPPHRYGKDHSRFQTAHERVNRLRQSIDIALAERAAGRCRSSGQPACLTEQGKHFDEHDGATTMATGNIWQNFRNGVVLISSIITTNRNSTITRAYVHNIKVIPRNSACSSTTDSRGKNEHRLTRREPVLKLITPMLPSRNRKNAQKRLIHSTSLSP